MDDIFQRKKRRRPLARIGGLLFALLSMASLVEAIRAAPLDVGGGAQLAGVEAAFYRLAATLFSGAVATWLLIRPRQGRGANETDRLLR